MTEIKLHLAKKLRKALEREAEARKISLEAHIYKLLEAQSTYFDPINKNSIQGQLNEFCQFLDSIPGMKVLSNSISSYPLWFVQVEIDIMHKLSWSIVQELGFVFNYISITERLPTRFMPISSPPYLNGGPQDYLSWIIESTVGHVSPRDILEVLKERLPEDVRDEESWTTD